MSAVSVMPAGAEAEVASALLAMLRQDAGMQPAFGQPARVVDAESFQPAFPYVRLERHEVEPADSSCVAGHVHRLTLAVSSRHGGRVEARALVGLVRAAIEATPLSLTGQNVVLQQVVYSDVMRTSDLSAFRGLVRVRIITEEAV